MQSLGNNIFMRNKSYYFYVCCAHALMALFLIAAPDRICSQTVQADQRELARSQAPSPFGPNVPSGGVEAGHAAPTASDADLGEQQILKRAEEYEPLSVSVGVPFYWTSNVALSSAGEEGDFVTAPAAAVFYEPRVNRNVYEFIGLRQQMFYYDQFDEFDFGSFDLEVGFRVVVPQCHNLLLRFEYDFNRLTEKDSVEEFYTDHLFIANAEVPFRIGRAQQITLGVNESISVAAFPETPRRNDYEAYAGYIVNVARALSVNVTGRVVVRDYYHQDGRIDVSEILALGASYQVTRLLSAGAAATFASSRSNHSVFDYDVANLGGVVSFSARF